jgi:hypothetical protein
MSFILSLHIWGQFILQYRIFDGLCSPRNCFLCVTIVPKKVDRELSRRVGLLRSYASRLGVKTTVTSTYRSEKEQAELFAKRGTNPYPVSPPGCSAHQYGLAADIQTKDPRYQYGLSILGPYFGLYSNAEVDPIHFQVVSQDVLRSILPWTCRYYSPGQRSS